MANHPTSRKSPRRLSAAALLLGTVLLGIVLLGTAMTPQPVRGASVSPSGQVGSRAPHTPAAFHDVTPPNFPDVQEGTPAWGDYDNDGLLDLLLTGQLTTGVLVTRLYHNEGGGQFSNATPAGFPVAARGAAVWGDYDNDGQLDLILAGLSTGTSVTRVYHNDGGGAFHVVTPTGLPGLDFAAAAWGDYDNDGRLDFLISGYAGALATNIARLYHNDGNNVFHDTPPAGFPPFSSGSIAWGDYDNDGRLDLLFTGEGPTGILASLWHNDGGGAFHNATPPGLPSGDYGSVAWGDYDNDGLLDFFLTGAGPFGPLGKIYHNDGGGAFHDATPASVVGVDLSSVAWGDYDNDGLLDFLLLGDRNTGLITRLYHNDGAGQFSDVTPAGVPGLHVGSLSWSDYDGDGRLDFIVTGRNPSNQSVTRLYHNDGSAANTLPGAPGGLTASAVTTSSVALGWDAASDAETVSSGLSYNVRVGTAPGRADVVGPMANTDVLTETNGLRRLPALGPARPSLTTTVRGLLPGTTYYWSVQAIDTGWSGGPFATEGQFTTAPAGASPTSTASPTRTVTATNTATALPFSPTSTGTAIPTTPATTTATAVNTAVVPTATSSPPRPSATASVTAQPTATATQCAASFTDVHPTDYFYTPVLYLACRGVISGYADGTFRPYTLATRAQTVKIVVLGFGIQVNTPPGGAYTFSDVPPAYPFYSMVETAAARGIISGYRCGGPGERCDAESRPYFRPSANVTRGQLTKICALAAGWSLLDPPVGTFADVAPGSPFYLFVEAAASRSVISGYRCGGPGEACDPQSRPYFRTNNNASRGQIAKIVYLAATGIEGR